MMCFAAFDLVRNDEVLTDDMMNRYTVNLKYERSSNNNEQFEFLSDRMARNYPRYEMDENFGTK